MEQNRDEKITESLRYFERLGDPGIYSRIVYSKGALFFQALRDEIGDEAFFKALQEYYLDFQFDIAKPDDLLNIFEDVSGRSLDGFFEKWLYSP